MLDRYARRRTSRAFRMGGDRSPGHVRFHVSAARKEAGRKSLYPVVNLCLIDILKAGLFRGCNRSGVATRSVR